MADPPDPMLVVRVDPDAMSVEFVEPGVELADMDLGGNASGDDSGALPTDFPDRAWVQAAYEAPAGSQMTIEEMARRGDQPVWRAHIERWLGTGFELPPEQATFEAVDDAVAWARQRCPRVVVVATKDGTSTKFSAGTEPISDLPEYPSANRL